MNYLTASLQLTGRCWESRKIANHTYLKRRTSTCVAVRLHATDVLTFHDDGRIHVSTGGWNTVTTKDRINSHLPDGWRVWTESEEMFIGRGGWTNPVAAFNGNSVVIEADGTVTGGVSVEEKRADIRAARNEARRPVNRARYWIRKARTLRIDASECKARKEGRGYCDGLRSRWGRGSLLRGGVGTFARCGCKTVEQTPTKGKLTVDQILKEQNQTVRAAMISIWGMERFILDAGATTIAEREGYQLVEVKFDGARWANECVRALKFSCPSTGVAYLNTVPPNTRTVEEGLHFMFDLPEGVDYFRDVIQHA